LIPLGVVRLQVVRPMELIRFAGQVVKT